MSTGWTRGHGPKLVSKSNEAKGFPAGSAPSGTTTPVRSAPTAFSGSNVLALKPSERAEEATGFKRDYEERAAEFAEEIESDSPPDLFDAEPATTALFTDKAQADAAAAKTEAKKLEADRRARSIMQGYTGNMCSECSNFTMVRNGTCEKCDTCGATSGCS